MHVFVTGASGFIGQAVTKELVAHGHQVLGLVRSDAGAEIVRKAGGEPFQGSLTDLESLKKGAAATEGTIHLAFIHDFAGGIDSYVKACDTDRAAITAMGEVLAGTGKALIIAGGTLGLQEGVLGTEDLEDEKGAAFGGRSRNAEMVKDLSREKNIRGIVVRLAPVVHEAGHGGFLELLKDSAHKNGWSGYIDEGQTVWPAMHRQDGAALFRLILDKGRAGATYHGVGEGSVQMKDLATAVGKKLGISVMSKTVEEAGKTMGFAAHVITKDNPCSSKKTQKELGWTPVHRGLLAEVEASDMA
ncbi:hypothetical protein CLAFUW4_08922 [Fulvia fulva]|uniref:NAD-dependent epimerase/dehydratase domain-containing protein n=1 Tax=Passalora fulva TaxID=5499 RepID=A0A9Q8UTU3_PASFU|nr:uncharacterized protein CLAFUR5_09031 [Fulvia fulva]KAK4613773.1 hypothetical protein CLAFUR4_08928 [Fulvia fulva]KAK4614694.1 hypothetical protein CLAFUR0_08920 [Fulvia fulva]UJO22284.1 hypothetical protein CLAFUR5_09031 [Fulvia fulva]WPV20738.1 hypothetical protein CLAFUW4_08922 [Fulvia fulva]WPV35349.1 hypothetical protein CLAFUW7_08923 [Fulvia fulva]